MYKMATRQVRLREDHHRFVDDGAVTLSGLVRKGIDEAIRGERELPDENTRESYDYELVRTSVSVTPQHDDFIDSHDFVFSVLVHQLVEERIELERKLQEL